MNKWIYISAIATMFTLAACAQNTSLTNSQVHKAHGHQAQYLHTQAYIQSMEAMHQKMEMAAYAENPDAAFNLGMIPHHQGAIEMAKIELQYGQDATMRALAKKIIATQQPEIHQMNQWLDNHSQLRKIGTTPSEYTSAYLAMSWHDEMMKGVMATNPDVAFAQGMIAHHQGAIEMANIELKYGNDVMTKQLARSIIAAQQPEIEVMQRWLQQQ